MRFFGGVGLLKGNELNGKRGSGLREHGTWQGEEGQSWSETEVKRLREGEGEVCSKQPRQRKSSPKSRKFSECAKEQWFLLCLLLPLFTFVAVIKNNLPFLHTL